MEIERRMYSVKEVSALVHLSEYTVRKAIELGQIRISRICRAVRIPATEVERLLKGETVSAA